MSCCVGLFHAQRLKLRRAAAAPEGPELTAGVATDATADRALRCDEAALLGTAGADQVTELIARVCDEGTPTGAISAALASGKVAWGLAAAAAGIRRHVRTV